MRQPIKYYLFILFALVFAILPLISAQAEEQVIPKTKITICPNLYRSGEETLYLQGTAAADSQLSLQLKKDKKIIKTWTFSTDKQGEWFFYTNELLPSGKYLFLIQHSTGNADQCQVEIKFSGLSFLFLKISYRNLSLILFGFLLILLLIILFFVFKERQTKKRLDKEIAEARNILSSAFDKLDEQIKTRIEQIDTQPGFNPEEKKLYQDLKKNAEQTKKMIKKEIEDIEKFI